MAPATCSGTGGSNYISAAAAPSGTPAISPRVPGAITSMQLILAGQHNHTNEGYSEPFGGAVITGFGYPDAFPHGTFIAVYRYLQVYLNGGWYTVGYVG